MDRLTVFSALMDSLFEFSSVSGINQNMPRTYGTNDVMYMAEVHLLRDIRDMEGATVTLLAENSRKTKSAVTQLVNKLEAKDLIHKEKMPGSRNVLLQLTEKGKYVARYHDTLDREEYSKVLEQLSDFTAEDFERIKRLIRVIIDGSEIAIQSKKNTISTD